MKIEWRLWLLAGLAGALLLCIFSLAGFLAPSKAASAAILAMILIPMTAFGYAKFQQGRLDQQREKRIPDALLQASTWSPGSRLCDLFSQLARPEWGPLGADFKGMNAQLKAGKSEREVLRDWEKRCGTPGLKRTAGLMAATLETGADMRDIFRQAARDMLETQSVLRERSAMIWIQKMTLVFSAAVLVPGILGSVIQSSSQLDWTGGAEWGLTSGDTNPRELGDAILFCAQGYVLELALLASAAAALLENKKERFVMYSLFLLPAAWLVWKIAGGT